MILYCVVSRHWSPTGEDSTSSGFEILGQSASTLGNFSEVALALLTRIKPEETTEKWMTLQEEEHAYHYVIEKSHQSQVWLSWI